jgi:hypothetical protein
MGKKTTLTISSLGKLKDVEREDDVFIEIGMMGL